MHELSICQSIFQSLEENFPETELRHLSEIHLQIGVLSGVEPGYLQNAFELVIAGTQYENVSLTIETRNIIVECHHCGHRFTVEQQRFICPDCGQASSNVVEGNELKVSQIVIEEPDEVSHEKINK